MYDDIHAAVTERFESRQVRLLEELVLAPSHTEARDDVENAARLVDDAAAAIGLSCTRIKDPEGRYADHRIYATPATMLHDRALALVGHIDTVFPRKLGFLDFKRDGDAVRGPGVLDMKSGLTAILFALSALQRARPAAFAKLKARFVCVSDEELGSPSSMRVVYEGLASLTTSALVFEAGRERDLIVTARKGMAVYTVTALGRAAHAGNLHAHGVNALHALALLVPRIQALTDYEHGLTANVGLVEGGTACNTVPAAAKCVVDVRFTRSEDVAKVHDFFSRLTKDPFEGVDPALLDERVRQATFSVERGVLRPPMNPTSATQRLRARYERHAAASGLGVGEAPLQGGGSDGNLLAQRGVPVIDALGPFGQHFHRIDEVASLSSLRRRTRALASFLAEEAEEGCAAEGFR